MIETTMKMTRNKLAACIEHTLLKPSATAAEIEQLCREAIEHHFCGVCVNSCWVKHASECVSGTAVQVVSTAGFPLGSCSTHAKCQEVQKALADGAHEVDFVLNIGWLKSHDHRAIMHEFLDLVDVASSKRLKLILETCLLNDVEKRLACQLAVDAGIAYVKTSTGFSTGGAKEEDVRLMRSVVGERVMVKASGGIRDGDTALKMLSAGADKLGTSSGVAILKELYPSHL